MPCSDGGYSREQEDEMHAQAEKKRQQATRAMKDMNTMLCSACRILESAGFVFDKNPMLADWWAAHKANDEKRQLAEQTAAAKVVYEQRIVREALEKPFGALSPEEKALLKKNKYI